MDPYSTFLIIMDWIFVITGIIAVIIVVGVILCSVIKDMIDIFWKDK